MPSLDLLFWEKNIPHGILEKVKLRLVLTYGKFLEMKASQSISHRMLFEM